MLTTAYIVFARNQYTKKEEPYLLQKDRIRLHSDGFCFPNAIIRFPPVRFLRFARGMLQATCP